MPGVSFRPCQFEPTFQKHAGQLCGGAQLHVVDRSAFQPVQTAVSILNLVRCLAPSDFAWRRPPYEYEEKKMPIDILCGSDDLRVGIDSGLSADEILQPTHNDILEFSKLVDPYLLYD